MTVAARSATSAIGIHQAWLSQYVDADAGMTVAMILRILGTGPPCLEGQWVSSIMDTLDN
jgi:hypothetical protein